MSRHVAILAGIGVFLGANLSLGSDANQIVDRPQTAVKPDSTCTLTVRQIGHTGETETQTYDIPVADEKACKKAAKRHETNFAPQSVKTKTVQMKWGP